MKFIDSIKIIVRSGDGGPGMVSFKAARNMPKLGADGGDGGFGGNVLLKADVQKNTLSHLRYREHYNAENGARGGTNGKTGANGEDKIVFVPIGTAIFDEESGELAGEILCGEDEIIIAHGGKRGLGNMRFVSSIQKAPEKNTTGSQGEKKELRLELKLLADIGLAGMPNAGKSTLLSVISAAKPKIADYPFTTLTPQLGVVDLDDASFVVADIPGLIEGAAEGRGLGFAFLKHLERTSVIAYIVDAVNQEELNIEEKFNKLSHELKNFSLDLHNKKKVLVITKMDLVQDVTDREDVQNFTLQFEKRGIPVIAVSAAQSSNIKNLKTFLWTALQGHKDSL